MAFLTQFSLQNFTYISNFWIALVLTFLLLGFRQDQHYKVLPVVRMILSGGESYQHVEGYVFPI